MANKLAQGTQRGSVKVRIKETERRMRERVKVNDRDVDGEPRM